MSFADLLVDSCTIQNRIVDDSGMTDTESFTSQDPVSCRVFKNSATLFNAQKAQHATAIKTRFALPVSAVIAIRDRISHEGRIYDVVEVVAPFGSNEKHHKVAICEVIAGAV